MWYAIGAVIGWYAAKALCWAIALPFRALALVLRFLFSRG